MSADPHFMEYVRQGKDGRLTRKHMRWRVLGWTSIALSVVMVATSLTAYAAYRRLYGNIQQEDVNRALGGNRPPKLNKALNFLMIGSDTRTGSNAKYGRGLA